MKVRRRCRDIAQARHAQDGRIGRGEGMENSVALKQIAADTDALMAGDAAQGFEQPVSIQFLDRQRGGISREPAVELAAGRDQRPLKACDGIDDIAASGRRP
jgi:hypothetical protein